MGMFLGRLKLCQVVWLTQVIVRTTDKKVYVLKRKPRSRFAAQPRASTTMYETAKLVNKITTTAAATTAGGGKSTTNTTTIAMARRAHHWDDNSNNTNNNNASMMRVYPRQSIQREQVRHHFQVHAPTHTACAFACTGMDVFPVASSPRCVVLFVFCNATCVRRRQVPGVRVRAV